MKEIILSKDAPAPIGPYSQAVFVNDILYCSGQIPLDVKSGVLIEADIKKQTEKVCENIGAVLKSANLGFENVVKTTCFLTDMNDFADFNQIYAKYFISNPARSCVSVKELPKGALVEVEVIASK